MKLIVYSSKYIYDGLQFTEIERYSFDDEKYCLLDFKKFLSIMLSINKEVNINKFYDIQYSDTKFEIEFHKLKWNIRIKHILNDVQTQNYNKLTKYIPDNIIKKFLKEIYEVLYNKYLSIYNHNLDAIQFNNKIAEVFAEIEYNNKLHIDNELFGTFTGRITNQYVNIKKEDRINIFKNIKNVYEFDFDSFEVIGIMNHVGIHNINPYEIDNIDRQKIKNFLIPIIYGITKESLLKNSDDIETDSRIYDIIVNQSFIQEILNFKKKYIQAIKNTKKFISPISKIQFFYDNDYDIEHKSFNHLCQNIGADILKFKMYLLHNIQKKYNNFSILYTVYDSIVIETDNINSLATIKLCLEKELIINNTMYTNTVKINKLK